MKLWADVRCMIHARNPWARSNNQIKIDLYLKSKDTIIYECMATKRSGSGGKQNIEEKQDTENSNITAEVCYWGFEISPYALEGWA